MERLEKLALGCSSTSLGDIFTLVGGRVACPALRTLIVILPGNDPAPMWRDALSGTVRARVSRGSAIWRLRVILPSEEQIPLYSGVFDPFVQEIEIAAPHIGAWEDREHWLVWENQGIAYVNVPCISSGGVSRGSRGSTPPTATIDYVCIQYLLESQLTGFAHRTDLASKTVCCCLDTKLPPPPSTIALSSFSSLGFTLMRQCATWANTGRTLFLSGAHAGGDDLITGSSRASYGRLRQENFLRLTDAIRSQPGPRQPSRARHQPQHRPSDGL